MTFSTDQLLGPLGLTVGLIILAGWMWKRIITLEGRVEARGDAMKESDRLLTECRIENERVKGQVELWRLQAGAGATSKGTGTAPKPTDAPNGATKASSDV